LKRGFAASASDSASGAGARLVDASIREIAVAA
jgi:hypothetical protein